MKGTFYCCADQRPWSNERGTTVLVFLPNILCCCYRVDLLKGYILMKRGNNTCGIANAVTCPVV